MPEIQMFGSHFLKIFRMISHSFKISFEIAKSYKVNWSPKEKKKKVFVNRWPKGSHFNYWSISSSF